MTLPGAAQPKGFEGSTVLAIAFEPVKQPLERVEIDRILPLKTGSPLSSATVRASIERLYATGRYRDIQVDAVPSADGAAITFITKSSWFVGHVGIEGGVGEPPNNGQLINAARLDLGQPFQEEMIQPAMDGIRKLLIANGYFETTITPILTYSNETQEVTVNFAVKAGKRAKYDTPVLKGDLVLTPGKIIGATKWKRFVIGGYRQTTQRRTRQGVDGVRNKYENSKRLLATVTLESIGYDAGNNRAIPHLAINAGPQVEIKTIGTKISGRKLKENIPVFEEHTLDRDLLVEGQRNLTEELQNVGFFEAQVQFKEQRVVNGKQEIDYLIETGPRHRFVYLEITGNKYFTKDAIRERMFLEPKSLQFRHGRYNEAFVRRDEETITNLYRSNGFHDVVVSHTVKDDYKGKTGDIAAFFRIDEGQQWFVSHLTVRGAHQLDLSAVIPTLSSSEDQPYSEFNVASDRDTILVHYFENGFPNATFESSSKIGAKPNLVDLTYSIQEGERQFVRQVLLSGLSTTQRRIVDRDISLSSGDPLSPIAMSETQRKLYDLGVFAKVDMAIQNPEGQEDRKFIQYDIEEARRYSLTAGVGAEIARIGGSQSQASLENPGGATGFSPRVSLDLSRINFLGLGHTVSFRSKFSSFQRRGSINYLAPSFMGYPNLDLSFSTLYDDSHDVRTFSAKRAEGSVQLTDRLSKPTTAFLRFTYRRVNVSTLKIDPLLIPRLSQSVRVGILSSTLIQDRRDDSTDAHKGIYNTLDVGIASKVFGSQTSFVRILARNATYHRIGKKLVLARETTMGIAPAFSIPKSADPTDPIPLPERFFGGGGNSHRGFPDNQAGPRDAKTGFPLGGSTEFFNNTEMRFPLIGSNVGGVFFHDMGNVYSSIGKFSFRVNQHDINDFNYMVHAAGMGVRYRTPIGPVRVDLAYSINSPRFNGFRGTFDQLLQCSASQTCVSSVQRINHLQFFFSIGQTF